MDNDTSAGKYVCAPPGIDNDNNFYDEEENDTLWRHPILAVLTESQVFCQNTQVVKSLIEIQTKFEYTPEFLTEMLLEFFRKDSEVIFLTMEVLNQFRASNDPETAEEENVPENVPKMYPKYQ